MAWYCIALHRYPSLFSVLCTVFVSNVSKPLIPLFCAALLYLCLSVSATLRQDHPHWHSIDPSDLFSLPPSSPLFLIVFDRMPRMVISYCLL